MADFRNDLLETLKQLNNFGIKYVICGGVACVFQGVQRATFDVDISVSFETENLEKIIKLAKELNLKPRMSEPIESFLNEDKRRDWFENKGALVYTLNFYDSPMQLDIFLNYPLSYLELNKKADTVEIDGFKFLISSKEDLLKVKKMVNPMRTKDKIDIEELEKLIENENKSD